MTKRRAPWTAPIRRIPALTPEEKARWAPMLQKTWGTIGYDGMSLLSYTGSDRRRQSELIELVVDANRPMTFADMTAEEYAVLGRSYASGNRDTMKWLRSTLGVPERMS